MRPLKRRPPSGTKDSSVGVDFHWACPARRLDSLASRGKRGSVARSDAEAKSRPIHAYARPIVVAAVVAIIVAAIVITVIPGPSIVTPGMPALAGAVTDQPCLLKQRRALSDLSRVSGVCVRGYEGTGAGEQCQCQSSHVHLLCTGPKATPQSR